MAQMNAETPGTWPATLKAQWDALAPRHNLDPQHPTESIWGAYHRLTRQVARRLIIITTTTSDLARAREAAGQALGSTGTRKPVTCQACRASDLRHFYTSSADGRALCAACFQR